MNISFADRRWQDLFNDDSKLHKKFGKIRAEKIRLRMSQLHAAETLEDTRHLPGRYHDLTGTRKGQWACDLDQPYRLIFKPHEDPIPADETGKYIWLEILGVEIIEIVDYH